MLSLGVNPSLAASAALVALQCSGCDFLKVAGNSELLKFMDKNAKQGVNVESVQFSDSVLKINKREKQQKRDLIITTANVYNFKQGNYKTCQRSIPLSSIKGVVLNPETSELLLQVRNDYDYRLLIVRSADFIRVLSEVCERLSGGMNKLSVEILRGDLSKMQVLKADVRDNSDAAEMSTNSNCSNSATTNRSNSVALSPLPSPMSTSSATYAASSTNAHHQSNLSDSSLAFSMPPSPLSANNNQTNNNNAASSSAAAAAAAGGSRGHSLSGEGRDVSVAPPLSNPNHFELKPSCEGWLTKKGEVNLLWRRRYFRLAESNLLYYEARLKGTIELVAGGEVRAWVNKRLSMIPRASGGSNNLLAQTTHSNSTAAPPNSAANGGNNANNQNGGAAHNANGSNSSNNANNLVLSPLLYEYKLSTAYNINPEKHLKDILFDQERFHSFVAFCESMPQQQSQHKINAAETTTTATHTAAPAGTTHNESGNPIFYAAVEKFKALDTNSSSSSSSSSPTPLSEATRIYSQFLSPTAPTPINAPSAVKAAIGSLLARQGNAAAFAAANKTATTATASSSSATDTSSSSSSSSSFAPSSALLHADMFNMLQQFVLDHMQAHVLPSYLRHSKASEALVVQDFRLKSHLSEEDKKKSSCSNCLSSFGLLRRRHVCKYCGDVFCAACLTKSSKLPLEYGLSDPIKTCDMCFGILEISHAHPHAFSYAHKNRSRPINLAASSPQELQQWMTAFRTCIQLQQSKIAPGGGGKGDPSANATTSCHKEGWLMKEDPTTKIWRRRYFILNSDTAQLYYYELLLKGSLSLSQGAGVHATIQKATLSSNDSSFGGLLSRSQFAWRFSVSYHARLYALASDSKEQMDRWMDELQKAIRRAKPGNGLIGPPAAGGLTALVDNKTSGGLTSPSSALTTPTASGASGGGSGSSSSADHYSSSFSQKAPEGEVTFVFTDVQNSTKLWELAPEGMNKALEKHDALLRMLLTVFKGYEVKTEGDAFMVTFFHPLDAVRWCLACQQSLLESEWPASLLSAHPSGCKSFARDPVTGEETEEMLFNGLRIRMGIHVGHPSCRRNPITGRMDYFGPVVNRSARVADSAHGGQIVCTEEVALRVRQGVEENEFPNEKISLTNLGKHKYKGISGEVDVWQIHNQQLEKRNPFPELRTTKADEKEEAEGEGEEEAAEGEGDNDESASSSSSSSFSPPLVPASSSSPGLIGGFDSPRGSGGGGDRSNGIIAEEGEEGGEDADCDLDPSVQLAMARPNVNVETGNERRTGSISANIQPFTPSAGQPPSDTTLSTPTHTGPMSDDDDD